MSRSILCARRRFHSNRLDAVDATPDVVDQLQRAFARRLRDRNGRPPRPRAMGLRLLEKTPKSSLRVPFLAEAFPDALFVYLYRDMRDTISSMLDAWRSGDFVTYPNLPEWEGPPWSLLLTPGWRELSGKPLAEIVAAQWSTATRYLLDDLERLSPDRWAVANGQWPLAVGLWLLAIGPSAAHSATTIRRWSVALPPSVSAPCGT